MADHYKILGIERSATPEEVKKAYFVMAKKYHPDSGDETEIQKFHDVAEAYKVLSDPDSRKAYDSTLAAKEPEAKEIPKEPAFQTIHEKKRDSYRDEELKTYNKNRFKRAVFRVIGFTAMVGLIAYVVALILLGTALLGLLAGIFIGFSLSINKNFNVASFFDSDKKHKHFKIFTWILFAVGLSYFVWLIVRELF